MVGSTKTAPTIDHGYLRKIRKPLIEKKRRDRMNRSIEQLKMLLADSIVTDTKMDKADILDLTVSHLQRLKNHQSSASMATEASSYSSGFRDCAKETINHLSLTRVITPESMGHLSNHLNSVYDKKTARQSVEVVTVENRASSPAIQTSPPQYCSTPVQGLHSLLDTSAYSVTDSFSDRSTYSHSGPVYSVKVKDSSRDTSVYSQLNGVAYSEMDISRSTHRWRVSGVSRRLSDVSGCLSDTHSYVTEVSVDSALGVSSASDIEDIISEEKPWRPW